jgi:hypothetical protein
MTVTRRRVSIRKKQTFWDQAKSVIFSTKGFPIVMTLSMIGVLFILFRMKGVELDYKITELNKNIKIIETDGKELKAKKADLLSVQNLRLLASKYNLKPPTSKQVIVIP